MRGSCGWLGCQHLQADPAKAVLSAHDLKQLLKSGNLTIKSDAASGDIVIDTDLAGPT